MNKRIILVHEKKEVPVVIKSNTIDVIAKAIKNKLRLSKDYKTFTLDGKEVDNTTKLENGQKVLVAKNFSTFNLKERYIEEDKQGSKVTIIGKDLCKKEAIDAIYKLSRNKGVINVLALPDLTLMTPCPVGTEVTTEDLLYPSWIGNDIGCGVTLFELKTNGFNKQKAIKKLKENYTDKWNSEIARGERKYFHESDYFMDLDLKKHDPLFGRIGGGNHFCEIQECDGKYYICVHSGSRSLGVDISEKFPNKFYTKDSKEAKHFMLLQNFGIMWAYYNRQSIATRICATIGLKMGNRVTDLCHNFVTQEGNKFIHRKGAIPGNKGLAMIPGSRGTHSYLVKGLGTSSLPHGAGRKLSRKVAEERFSQKNVPEPNVICRNKKLRYQEAPGAYKNIDDVISSLDDKVQIVKIFKPVLTYKV